MVNKTEIIIWTTFSILSYVYSIVILSRKNQIHTHIQSIYLQIIFAYGCYGLFYVIGLINENSRWIQFGFCWLCFIFYQLFHAFQEIFGETRNYRSLQHIQLVFISFAFGSIMIEPPIFTPLGLEMPYMEKIFLLGAFFCFCIIALDYSIFAFHKVQKENLSKSLLIFPKIVLFGIIAMMIAYYLLLLKIIYLYLATFIVSIFFMAEGMWIILHPEAIFLAPINPLYFDIVSKQGIPIYFEQLGELHNTNLIHGSVAAINAIFQEVTNQDVKIKIIKFEEMVCYIKFFPEFFIVFMDEQYSTIIEQRMEEFGILIHQKLADLLEIWDGNVSIFDWIQDEFHSFFSFLPKFVSKTDN